MLTFGPLGVAAPMALLGLVVLPLIWLLLRAAPPSPKRRVFPPFRLLLDLVSDEETQERTPWWLVLLRLILAALVILALARPVLFPAPPPEGRGPLLLAIDDGWAAAADWGRIQAMADSRIEAAGRDGRDTILLFTAPQRGAPAPIERLSARDARRAVDAHAPAPWPVDRAAAAERLASARERDAIPSAATPEWISDGIEDGGAIDFGRALTAFGSGRISEPGGPRAPLALDPPRIDGDGFVAVVRRAAAGGERIGALIVLDAQGRSLARASFVFEADATAAEARVTLPIELRNEARLVAIEGQGSAGAAQMLDDRWRRTTVGLAAGAADQDRQPLLDDLHYVENALQPVATTRRASLSELLDEPPSAIVLVDAGRVVGIEAERLTAYVENGGLLVRFAGPRLAARADDLVPTPLRSGDRALGGALAWDEPQRLAPFDTDSPFYGLAITEEAVVERQVLADPTADLAERTWARLEDGTPLVTSARRGQGRLVLFHVTAAPAWSDLPLTGLFAEMIARTLVFADARPTAQEATSGDWRLETALDADGRLAAPPADLGAVTAENFAEAQASAATPPGLWTRPGGARAINVIAEAGPLEPLPALPAALERLTETGRAAKPLSGPLLGLALLIFAIDAIAVAALAGLLTSAALRPGRRARGGATAALLAACVSAALVATPHGAEAQQPAQRADDTWVINAISELHLAYVRTGDAEIDRMSAAGLQGLSNILNARTTVEPGAPIGVDIETDPFEILPMLYWPVTPDTQPPSLEAAARIDAYLKSGGVIVLDTQDAGTAAVYGAAPHPGLQRLVDAIDVPPLEPTPPDHVLTKAFYLLQEWPGRWRDATLWVVAASEETTLDGVSSVIVTSADWASAWAVDSQGQPLAAVSPDGERQRELAYRSGVNVVMYVLTGNYKADQVHVPAILERLGQ